MRLCVLFVLWKVIKPLSFHAAGKKKKKSLAQSAEWYIISRGQCICLDWKGVCVGLINDTFSIYHLTSRCQELVFRTSRLEKNFPISNPHFSFCWHFKSSTRSTTAFRSAQRGEVTNEVNLALTASAAGQIPASDDPSSPSSPSSSALLTLGP